jgi:SAM-dependent methyltransferase
MPRREQANGRYTFGEGDCAESRLEDIASFFNVAAAAFIRKHAARRVGIAADIGCGPGFTTAMLARTVTSRQVVGLDISGFFLRRAAARLPNCRFVRHDVRNTPFPIVPDLAYCRFVLSHIPDAPALVRRWCMAINPEGLLILDELEDIETDLPVFRRYLEVNGGLVASQGADLWVGSALHAASFPARVAVSETARLVVPNRLAASWFHPNTETIWRREPYVLERVNADERERIASSLARIRETGRPRGHAVWIMRRMMIERLPGS